MLRIARARRFRIALLLGGAALGASCANEMVGAGPASAVAPALVERDEAGAEPSDSSSDAAAREAVDRLTFEAMLLKEDIRQAPEREAECRTLFSVPTRVPIQEKLARLRADSDRIANSLADPQLVRELRERVLDVLSVYEQRNTLEKLRFDFELLKEDVKQRDVWSKQRDMRLANGGKHVALDAVVQLVKEKLARIRADSARLAPAVTDVRLAQELKTNVLDPLDALAKSSPSSQR